MPQGEQYAPIVKLDPDGIELETKEKPEHPSRMKGEEVLSSDGWRGDWYRMGFGEVWIDTGQIDVLIKVADGDVQVTLYPNKPDREALAEASVIRFNGVWEDGDSWMDHDVERNEDG